MRSEEIIALLGGLDFYILGGFNGIAIGDCNPLIMSVPEESSK